jgi:group I intron endonuclease
MRFGSVYLLTNQVTGDTYVGITTRAVRARWKEHTYKANGRRCTTWLHRAIRKYGPEAFSVAEMATALNQPALLQAEMYFIRDIAPTYNQSHGGEGTTGRKFSPDVLAARNAKLRGRKKSPEERARISAGRRAAMTPEIRAQAALHLVSARLKVNEGKRIEAVRRSSTERVWSEESRAKLSASCMGRRYPPDVIDRMKRAKMKPVVCVTNGKRYDNAKDAAKELGIGHGSVIRVLKGKYPAVKGLSFTYGE